jgi:hypothetical protein
MSGQEKRVTSGINEYINTLKAKAGGDIDNYNVNLNLFDSERWREYYSGPLKKFPEMGLKDYQPGAMTPLYDAIFKSISHTQNIANGAKILMFIDTDGMENSSSEVTREQVFNKIKQKEDEGWTFVFLGAEMDEFGGADVAQQKMGLGIASNNTLDLRNEDRKVVYSRAAKATSSLMDDKHVKSDKNFWGRAE